MGISYTPSRIVGVPQIYSRYHLCLPATNEKPPLPLALTSSRQSHTEKALQHYVLDGFVSAHVALHQGMSKAYLYLSSFEEDVKRRQAMYSRRCACWARGVRGGEVRSAGAWGRGPLARSVRMVFRNSLWIFVGMKCVITPPFFILKFV